MKDDIKEILTKLKIVSKTEEGGAYICDRGHCKLLLDYITNLQEQLHQASLDIQELTERDIECPSWCDKLTNLQNENDDLKSRLENAVADCNLRIQENTEWKLENERLNRLFKNSVDSNIDLQDRIDKAISLLKEAGCYDEETKTFCDDVWGELPDLLNILQGEDNDKD